MLRAWVSLESRRKTYAVIGTGSPGLSSAVADTLRALRPALAVGAAAAAATAGGVWCSAEALVSPRLCLEYCPAARCRGRPRTASVPDGLRRRFPRAGAGLVVSVAGGPASWPGIWGLTWPGGRGVVGEPLEVGVDGAGARSPKNGGRLRRLRVQRPLLVLDGEPPQPGPRVRLRWDPCVWPDDPAAVDPPAREVSVDGPLGPLPCWQVDGSGADRRVWLLAVHGRGAPRAQAWRLLQGVRRRGLSGLVLAYRNDPGAPSTGRYQLGQGEWEDLDAAVSHARSQGARRVVLAGWSMGGAIVSTFLRRSDQSGRVAGVILDAPVLDWSAVLRRVARQAPGGRLLHPLASHVLQLASWRAGIDRKRLDLLASAEEFAVPILLFHGERDATVPIASSRQLACARPDLVTYVPVAHAAHGHAWNAAPDAYDRAVTAFLDRCLDGRALHAH